MTYEYRVVEKKTIVDGNLYYILERRLSGNYGDPWHNFLRCSFTSLSEAVEIAKTYKKYDENKSYHKIVQFI